MDWFEATARNREGLDAFAISFWSNPMFTSNQLRRSLQAWSLRLVALGCAVLVGLLALAAVSPEIHAAFHGSAEHHGGDEPAGPPAASDHSCAVTLFSQGFESGLTPTVALQVPESVITEVIALADQVARAARTAQLPPGRGPPVS